MLPENMQVVIPSRGRSKTIADYTFKLMPYATVTVDESELEDYARVIPEAQLLPHPKFKNLVEIGNWMFDNIDVEFMFLANDDLLDLRSNIGWRARHYREPEIIASLLETLAVCAKDVDAYLFGFGHHQSKPYYPHTRPFKVNGYVRNVLGFRRGHDLRWDVPMYGDVDLALQAMLKHRIVWRDDRFVWTDAPLGSNFGGNAGRRTSEALLVGKERMKEKWGPYVSFESRRALPGRQARTEATVLRVPRRDTLIGKLTQ